MTYLPKHNRSWHAELDEYVLDVVLEVFGVKTPRSLFTSFATKGRIRGPLHSLDVYNRAASIKWNTFDKKGYDSTSLCCGQQVVQNVLGYWQNLFWKPGYEVLSKFSKLIPFQFAKGFRHRSPEPYGMSLNYKEK